MSRLVMLTLGLLAGSAQAANYFQAIPEGSYKGVKRVQDKGNIHLIVKNYAGCDGCFVAIFVDDSEIGSREVALVAYSAFPRNKVRAPNGDWTSSLYSLVPMGTTVPPKPKDRELQDEDYDGDLTLPNADPSLIIDVQSDLPSVGTENVKFKITSAQSGNFRGIKTTMDFFKAKDSPYSLWEPTSGHYRAAGKRGSSAVITVKPSNPADGSRSASITWDGAGWVQGGDFVLAEKAPSVFTFNAIKYLVYGEKVKKLPTFLVMFFKMHSEQMVLMVNPFQETGIHKLLYKGE